MNKSELVNKYSFLRESKADHPFGCKPRMPYPMFGIECGDGWLPLLDELFAGIEAVVRRDKLKDFQIDQIKEKFGTLRVYVSGANREIHKLIREAEVRSGSICERCGKPGQTASMDGWYVTLCERHYKSRAEERRRRFSGED